MSKRLMSMGVLVGFLFSLLLVTGAFAQKEKAVFDVSYGKVTFTHKKHADALKGDCVKCHHTWKKGETTGKQCGECHKEKAEGKALSKKDAYHKDCQGCHNEAKKANKPAGPTACTQCHVKAAKK
jgi:hypothetical protein